MKVLILVQFSKPKKLFYSFPVFFVDISYDLNLFYSKMLLSKMLFRYFVCDRKSFIYCFIVNNLYLFLK